MRYFLGFLIAIGLLALVVIIVVKSLSNNTTGPQPKPLSSYSNTDAVASLLISGPTVADQNYRQVEIDIAQVSSQISIIDGYQGTIANTNTFENNASSYSAFLSALQKSGFALVDSKYNYKTPAGFCPFGTTYTYTFTNGNDKIINSWATSCGGQGNFRGLVATVNQLFQTQIPDFPTFVSQTSL